VIGLSGSYGGLNVGDEAILTAANSALRTAVPGSEIVVFSRNAQHTREQQAADRVIASREAMLDEMTAETERLDLLLLGGGGILYDRESERYLHVARVAQRAAVPTATYAIGVGPLERTAERQAVAEVLNGMRFITVRDVRAKLLLQEIGVERPIAVTGDPALALVPEPFTREMLQAEGIPIDRRIVGMSVREPGGAAAALDGSAYHGLLADAADFIAARFDAEILFVPMEQQDVREAHRVIGEMAFSERAMVLRGDYRPGQLLGLMDHLDLAVGMRLHFLIFAAVAGLPLVALPYASKVTAFMEALGIPRSRAPDGRHAGPMLAALDRLWDTRARERDRLRERVGVLQRSAARTAQIVREVLDHDHDADAILDRHAEELIEVAASHTA
jgi:polysaccharide pyruvyl transferase CsaB